MDTMVKLDLPKEILTLGMNVYSILIQPQSLVKAAELENQSWRYSTKLKDWSSEIR